MISSPKGVMNRTKKLYGYKTENPQFKNGKNAIKVSAVFPNPGVQTTSGTPNIVRFADSTNH